MHQGFRCGGTPETIVGPAPLNKGQVQCQQQPLLLSKKQRQQTDIQTPDMPELLTLERHRTQSCTYMSASMDFGLMKMAMG